MTATNFDRGRAAALAPIATGAFPNATPQDIALALLAAQAPCLEAARCLKVLSNSIFDLRNEVRPAPDTCLEADRRAAVAAIAVFNAAVARATRLALPAQLATWGEIAELPERLARLGVLVASGCVCWEELEDEAVGLRGFRGQFGDIAREVMA